MEIATRQVNPKSLRLNKILADIRALPHDELIFVKSELLRTEPIEKQRTIRKGWNEAFAQYAQNGEDELMLPDFVDAESDVLL